ncbi:DNA protecting protein DprA [Caldalkalibacillus thermarum TA2.A1]|uniref:DNA protecting protein DprA n=1 Tax=Caldalkalibacillus thermarum (strain TA2.A1) TaxID=986075 RepID=F5L827_CALTT|nr:DNA-processing protein DprA [Caldalkalibacillus thermarum]EGL82535.1 DNA protecting protein DprA [Caldalkalibacillus thermarum TA2.A1]QZT33031.1 DNA-processing protein DprA [Caldalkalibacillus thermarum TA2.A1]
MRDVLLGLAITPGVGWKTIYYLLQGGLDQTGFNLSAAQWKKYFKRLTDHQARALSQTLNTDKITDYKKQLEDKHVGFFTITDDNYPAQLKEIAQPPWLLFVRGNVELLNTPCLAVVGSRKTTAYGQAVTKQIVPKLTEYGLSIVSGMALGIDALAHQAALEAGGGTIAVLGAGIDIIYPQQNRHLYHRLLHQGLLISEYPLQTAPHPGFFPQRNRIIAGISFGVLVVEAAQKSGSLITAQYALENGREVFAVPGSIFNPQSAGTNHLIQQNGAKLVSSYQDILEELQHFLPRDEPPSLSKTAGLNELEMADDKEKMLLALLNEERMHINELHHKSGLSFSEIQRILLKLEMKKLVIALPGSFYQRQQLPSKS